MNKLFNFIRNNHDNIFKGILALFSVLLIVYVLPKEAKFKYEFTKGKPWLHENLIAPFDFAIYKSEQEIKSEQEEIKINAKPYFKLEPEIAENRINAFKEEFENKWVNKYVSENEGLLKKIFKSGNYEQNIEKLKTNTLETGTEILNYLYSSGIIKIADIVENKPSDFSIIILNDKLAEEKELKDVFTLQTAYDYVRLQIEKKNIETADFLISLLENALVHNLFYDDKTTQKVIYSKLENISITRGKIEKDVGIISRGDIVTDEIYQVLQSLKKEYEKQMGGSSGYYTIVFGQFLIVSILISLVLVFLFLFRKDIAKINTHIIFILLMIVLMVYMSIIPIKIEKLSIYMLPFCILPIIIRAFFDTRMATFITFVSVLIIGFFAPNGFDFVLIQLVTGIVAVFSIVSMRRRSQLFTTSLIIFLVYSATYTGLAIVQQGDWRNIDTMNYVWFSISAMLTLFAYPLMYVFEKAFGFLSDVALIELSDTNNILLRELAQKAPGTFQHSLQVANLTEEVISQIGGNALLVRTASLYHDIGKMDAPPYFIENQSGINPHRELKNEESARIIIRHVIRGIELAKQYKIPEQIIDFIRTHHGTTKTRYFYNAWKNEHPGESINDALFTYPGPIPFSKEGAVLMMADSVEAASRSLKSYTAESVGNLVEGIIDDLASQGQFANSDITFKDITEIKKILKRKLLSIYHIRVEYPKTKGEF